MSSSRVSSSIPTSLGPGAGARLEPADPSIAGLLLRAVDTTSSAISLIDVRDERLLYVNAAYERLTGFRAEEVLGGPWAAGEGTEDASVAMREIREAFRRGSELRVCLRRRRRSGDAYWSETFLSPVPDGSGAIRRFMVVEKDVTTRVELEERAAHLAYHDTLTGLPNRAQLQEHMALALARAARGDTTFGLLFFDLDGFKAANDHHGHEAGDHVLKEVARRWLEVTRGGDVLARYGGDEFVVLLKDLPQPEPQAAATACAERYSDALREPVSVSDAPGAAIPVSTSVGVAIHPEDGESASELLMTADAAMYVAKRAFRSPTADRAAAAPGALMSVIATMSRASAPSDVSPDRR